MRKYFKGINTKAADGWMLGFVSGNSAIDGQDWIIDTNSLHADEVPQECTDAKTFSQLVAGLLNAYYNDIETKDLDEITLMNMGTVEEEEEIPGPENPKLPF